MKDELIQREQYLREVARADHALERMLASDQASHIAMRAMGGDSRVDKLESRIKMWDMQGNNFNQKYLEQQSAAMEAYLKSQSLELQLLDATMKIDAAITLGAAESCRRRLLTRTRPIPMARLLSLWQHRKASWRLCSF